MTPSTLNREVELYLDELERAVMAGRIPVKLADDHLREFARVNPGDALLERSVRAREPDHRGRS